MILKQNIPLKKYSNYKIGGIADYFYEFDSKENLIAALLEYKEIDPELKDVFIIGSGTNILFLDKGYQGLVLKDRIGVIEAKNEVISVSAGVLMSDLIDFATKHSLSGLEWAGGLPGTVGGAVRGNAGAFGGETKDNVYEVESIDISTLKIKKRKNSECSFDYRNSVFKSGSGKREIILNVKFKLKKGVQSKIKDETQEKIDYRIDRHPLNYPNIGSTFKNIPIENVDKEVLEEFKDHIKNDPFKVLPVAKLIAVSGLIGYRVGDAEVSTKHPNFIVNIGNTKARDVLSVIAHVKEIIKEKYNIDLEEEIMVV